MIESTSSVPDHAVSQEQICELSEFDHINLHVQSGDYFAHLATLLGCIEELLSNHELTEELINLQLAAIRATRTDLDYLNAHFRIENK